MKKLLRHLSSCGLAARGSWPLLLAVALAALWAAPAQAEDYGLYVCGVQVTDANKDNLSATENWTDGWIDGTVTYDPATKTLRLKNAYLKTGKKDGDHCSGIENVNVDGLTIEVVGFCNIDSKSDDAWYDRYGICMYASTVIKGAGDYDRLTVSSNITCIYVNYGDIYARSGATCTISDLDVNASSTRNEAIRGIYYNEYFYLSSLIIKNATVRATGANGSIRDFDSVTLDDCKIVSPAGAAFVNRSVRKDGKVVTEEVYIRPADRYGLYVCGEQVTELNKDDLSAIAGVTGTATYDPSAKVLRLKDAAIVAAGDNRCIENAGVAGLAVEVEGACTMESGTDGIAMDASTVIRGKSGAEAPTLSVVSGNTGIRMRAATSCTISDLGLTAEGSVYGIAGKDGVSGTLAIENATVRAKGGQGSIRDFSSVTLKGCLVLTPEDAAFDGGTLKKDGKVVAGEAVIVPGETYGLKVCGVPVTDVNKDDLSAIPGVTGSVTYDPSAKTLRLKDARIEAAGDNDCIKNESVDGLTVEVEGKCAMESGTDGISMGVSTTIAGKSGAGVRSLVVSAAGTGVQVGNADHFTFTIRVVDLTVTGQNYGIAGNAGNAEEDRPIQGFVILRNEKLIIENASVRAKGGQGSIYNFSSLTLKGCKVLTPEGAAFDRGELKKDGALVTGEAVIGREYDLRICGVQVTDMNKDDLSAIAGVTGTATYNPYANVLRLKDAAIEATGDNSCIDNAEADRRTIEVEGKCKLTSAKTGIELGRNPTITGKAGAVAPSLSVSAGDCGIRVIHGPAAITTIRDLDLTVTGQTYGIFGENWPLTIENATVRATGGQGSICNFESVELKGCMVLTPAGAAFDGGTLKKDGALVTGEAVIGREYDLRICGVQVTWMNKDDLSAIPGVTGTVTYDPYANALRLKDATIVAADGESCIESIDGGVDGLTVEVEGKCRMQAEMEQSPFCIGLQANTTIKGKSGAEAPSLACVAKNIGFAVRDGGSCTIRDLDLTATGSFGLAGGGSGSLTVENATVRATGGQGSICDFASVTLKGCLVFTPEDAAFDGGTLKKDGEAVTGEAVIAPGKTYGLYVCGVLVTDWNKDVLSYIPGVTGTVTYDPATKTLHLKNADIRTSRSDGIFNFGVERLTVEVEGQCAMASSKESGIIMGASTVITGKSGAGIPSLAVSGYIGILVENGASCTVRDLDLTATGDYGVAGSKGEHLAIENAFVRVNGNRVSIINFASVTLKNCHVVTPNGAAFDGGTLKKDGEVVTGEAVIVPAERYGLYVCGEQVTELNKDDLSAIPGVTGTATYDPATKTLRLKDAAIEAEGYIVCIHNADVEGLTVEVEGRCAMASGKWLGIVMDASIVITGKSGAETPSLAVSGNTGIGVRSGVSCAIRDLDLTATGQAYGIAGDGGGILAIENASVRATGGQGSICDFASVTLDDCKIVTPAGAAFDGGTLKKDGEVVTGEAVILPNDHPSVGIGTTAVDAPRREGTYTLSGVRLTAPLDQLPRGVYVVDGQKVVKK